MGSVILFLALLEPGLALLRPPSVPLQHVRSAVARLRVQPARLDESSAATSNDDKKLITIASLKGESLDLLLYTLDQRNKERFLEGKEQYKSIEAMVEEYLEYEGKTLDMSYAECEDAVLRYLQKKAIMDEGADGLGDPQTVVAFGLLGALVIGIAANLLGISVPLPTPDAAPR